MKKSYKLLKDLPYTKAGVIYTPENDDPDYYNYNGGEYRNRISKDYIEDNNEWFELLASPAQQALKHIFGNFSLNALPNCLRCGSDKLSRPEEIPGSHKWAYTYSCETCGAKHDFIYGDKMGGQADVIELKVVSQ